MAHIVINQDYKKDIGDFIEKLPSVFSSSGVTLEDSRNTIKVFEHEGMLINVKSFKKPHLFNQLMYATIRDSKAKRSYDYAIRLEKEGVNTPAPLAYIERTRGILLKRSALLTKQIDIDGEIRILAEGTLDDHTDLIIAFAKFTASLHEKNILHLDYSPGNILYKKIDDQYTFYLVDLNRMEFDQYISLDIACHNFRRMWGSSEVIKLLVREYAKARNFNEELAIKKTEEYRSKFWKTFNKRHPSETPLVNI